VLSNSDVDAGFVNTFLLNETGLFFSRTRFFLQFLLDILLNETGLLFSRTRFFLQFLLDILLNETGLLFSLTRFFFQFLLGIGVEFKIFWKRACFQKVEKGFLAKV
jgi:hypothetical protein